MEIDDFLDKESKERPADAVQKEGLPSGSESDAILESIEQIKRMMQEKKFEMAERRYNEVKEQYAQFSKRQVEIQNRIYNELVEINREMVVGLNSLRQDTEKRMDVIRQLLSRVRQHLDSNELDVANQVYDQVKAVYTNLPDLIPEKKVQLEQEMTALHLALLSRTHTAASADFEGKFREIQTLLNYGFTYVSRGDMDNANLMYQKVNALYNTLPKGFLYEKAVLYQQILKLFKSVEHKEKIPEQKREGP